MTRLTVLHLIDTGGPGGAETMCMELATGLNAGRWRSGVVVPVEDWLSSSLRSRGARPLILPTHRSFDVAYLSKLARIAHKCRADLIQTHLLTTAVYGGVVGRMLGIPVVATFHGPADVEAGDRLRALKMGILRHTLSRAVFVSASLRDRFRLDHGFDANTTVIHNGIDLRRFRLHDGQTEHREADSQEIRVVIGAVGNIRAPKNYSLLLKTAKLVVAQAPGCRFVIAGEGKGALYDALQVERRDLGIEANVTFIGFQEDVPSMMREFDIYVLSSATEGFSLTTVQAMACGIPVVSTRCGGPEEILHDGGGILVPTNAPEALAAAILSLATNPGERKRIGTAGRRIAESRFALSAMLAQYERLYDSVLSAQ